jgi:hypothetical protein
MTAVLDTPTKSKSNSKARSVSPMKKVLIQSPHAANPNADYIPPIPALSVSSVGGFLSVTGSGSRVLSRRSRSATPIPPYEPPTEVFTPPREVTISPPQPPASKSKRSSSRSVSVGSSTAGGTGTGRVKKELPDIDWTMPMPPPSPGDDPLLLSGRPRRARVVGAATSQSPSSRLAESSPTRYDKEDEEEDTIQLDGHGMTGMEGLLDVNMDMDMDVPPSTDLSSDAGPLMPIFDLASVSQDGDYAAGWSDSDSDSETQPKNKNELGGEGQGEYTGRFTMMTVRTKADPPTSATRNRMEGWGRPIR